MPAQADPRIILALDYPDAAPALALVARLSPQLCRVKVGKELFTRAGPPLVERLVAQGFQVFLDLKYHDIPNTVAAACAAAADLGVWMMNVHASGGRRMLEAARDSLAKRSSRPLLVAVTVLTSMDSADLLELGWRDGPEEQVLRLARLAQQAGLDGVVCSPREAARLRADLGPAPLLVTPGVRPASAAQDDQRRVMTPRDALAAGASYLVIGRPVTAAPDPLQALLSLNAELAP